MEVSRPGPGVALAVALHLAFCSCALSQSLPQRAALTTLSPEVAEAARTVVKLEGELAPAARIDYSARIDPVLRLRDYLNDDDGPDLDGGLGIDAQIRFAVDDASYYRSLQTLARARERLRLARIGGTLDALLAHAALLTAQDRERDTRIELDEAHFELEEARLELQMAPEDVSRAEGAQGELVELELELREARLDHSEAREELVWAREDTVAMGLASAAHYRRLRFELPGESAARRSFARSLEHRLLSLELLEARAELSEARKSQLDDLRLRAGYRTGSGEVDLEGGLVNGRPALNLGASFPGGTERWELEVSAQLVIDETPGTITYLEGEVLRAQQRLESFPAEFEREVDRALTRARLDESYLELAEEEAFQLGALLHPISSDSEPGNSADRPGGAPGSASEVVASGSASDVAGSTSDVAASSSDVAASGSPSEVDEDDLIASRLRVYRAWVSYVRSVGEVLELTGGVWVPVEDQGRPVPKPGTSPVR